MAKLVVDAIMDAALAKGATGTVISVCSTQPTTRTEAVTTYMLATQAMTAGDGNGDYVIADGDVNGRKLRVLQQGPITITNSGDAEHVAICDGTDLLLVTTCTSQTLTAGGTVTVPEWSHTIADVTA
jgi:hypothetical protein